MDAIHLIRGVLEYGESSRNYLYVVLLDWENAFDKVDRSQLFNSMKRMGVDQKLIDIVKFLQGSSFLCTGRTRWIYFRLATTTYRNQTRMPTITILIPYCNDNTLL